VWVVELLLLLLLFFCFFLFFVFLEDHSEGVMSSSSGKETNSRQTAESRGGVGLGGEGSWCEVPWERETDKGRESQRGA
jgi:hypothetical protein